MLQRRKSARLCKRFLTINEVVSCIHSTFLLFGLELAEGLTCNNFFLRKSACCLGWFSSIVLLILPCKWLVKICSCMTEWSRYIHSSRIHAKGSILQWPYWLPECKTSLANYLTIMLSSQSPSSLPLYAPSLPPPMHTFCLLTILF